MAFNKNHKVIVYNKYIDQEKEVTLEEAFELYKKYKIIYIKNKYNILTEMEMSKIESKEIVDIELSNGFIISSTLNNIHKTNNGDLPSYELCLDDKIIDKDCEYYIKKIELKEYNDFVYNVKMFDVEENQFRLSNNILVTALKKEHRI